MKAPMVERDLDVMETAARWLLRAEHGLEPIDAGRLDAWLASDPEHRAAYRAVLEAGEVLERAGPDDALLTMRAAALRASPKRKAAPWAIAASVVFAAVTGGWWLVDQGPGLVERAPWSRSVETARYVTAAGERATISLTDGSTLALNTDSAAEIVFDRDGRRVRLLKGQALFTVSHDPSRPFEVFAADQRVTAVGTVFDVLILPRDLRVAMLSGVVRVSAERRGVERREPQILSAGEVMTARPDGSVSIRKMDTARLAGWREGVIYFEDTPLAEAVVEMSRYTRHPLGIADRRAGELRVSGAFRATEAETFADTMTDLFPLDIQRSEDGSTRLSSTAP